MALKKPVSFEELVQENRRQMLQDESILEKIEQGMKADRDAPTNRKASN